MKRFNLSLFTILFWLGLATVGSAAEANSEQPRAEAIFNLITNVVVYAVATTFVVRFLLGLIEVDLKKKGTIILAVVVLVVFILVGVFFPQWPLPTLTK